MDDWRDSVFWFTTSILKFLVILIRLALIGAMYWRIAPYFALHRIFSPANEKALLKQNNQSNFKSCLKIPNELQENEKKLLKLSKNQLITGSIKQVYRLYLSYWSLLFQNGCNKVIIELRFVQFWPEIMFVIFNRVLRSFDFEITRMISDKIALHSVQLSL